MEQIVNRAIVTEERKCQKDIQGGEDLPRYNTKYIHLWPKLGV